MCEERHNHMPKRIGKYIVDETEAWKRLWERYNEMESDFKEKKKNKFLPLILVESLKKTLI
jgi:hypothetical protein